MEKNNNKADICLYFEVAAPSREKDRIRRLNEYRKEYAKKMEGKKSED